MSLNIGYLGKVKHIFNIDEILYKIKILFKLINKIYYIIVIYYKL